MKIKQVEVRKEFKCGLPNYSNITVTCGLVAELGESEEVKWDDLWNEINKQCYTQTDGLEPSWINTKEYTNFFKTIIKTKKGGQNDNA